MKENRKYILMLIFVAAISATLFIQGMEKEEESYAVVDRLEEGEGTAKKTYSYSAGDLSDEQITIDVASVERTDKEARELIEEAIGEWEGAYLGENSSAEAVYKDLYFPETLQDGLVEASYSTNHLSVIDSEGKVDVSEVSQDGELIDIEATFSYGDIEETGIYTVRAVPYPEGSAEWLEQEIYKAAAESEESTRTKSEFALPDEVDGISVFWEGERDMTWLYVLVLGIVVIVCLKVRAGQNEREEKKKRNKRLMDEYPGMVDQLVLLTSSGMTVRRAWERIIKNHENDDLEYIREMKITFNMMKEGRGERECYERFGDRIGLMPYRKIGSILSQAVSKGTRDVQRLLEAEGEEALERRRSIARKKGAEAETALLFPMLVMLGLVLAILMVPALGSFSL